MYIKNKNQFEVLFLHKHEILTFEYARSQGKVVIFICLIIFRCISNLFMAHAKYSKNM